MRLDEPFRSLFFLVSIFSIIVSVSSLFLHSITTLNIISGIMIMFIIPGYFLIDFLTALESRVNEEEDFEQTYQLLIVPAISISLFSVISFALSLVGMLDRQNLILFFSAISSLFMLISFMSRRPTFSSLTISEIDALNPAPFLREPGKIWMSVLGLASIVMSIALLPTYVNEKEESLQFYILPESGDFTEIEFEMELEQIQTLYVWVSSEADLDSAFIHLNYWEINDSLPEKETALVVNLDDYDYDSGIPTSISFLEEGHYRVEYLLFDSRSDEPISQLLLQFSVGGV